MDLRWSESVEYGQLLWYSFLGILTGKIVNSVNERINKLIHQHVDKAWLLSACAQVAVLCAVPVLLERTGYKLFVQNWQISTAGLFWVSFFLSSQTSITAALA